MTLPVEELLYNLLPAIYRSRDVAQGEPLRALLGLMEREFQAIQADIEGLYENLFIETCEEWVVPYIGDLLGLKKLGNRELTSLSRRAEVANTISYRRRKGTPSALGHVVRDVTGWTAKRVEFFDFLAATQHLDHLRPGKGGTVDLRNTASLERLSTAFDPVAHTVEVRSLDGNLADDTWRTHPLRGKHNVPNMGLFLWRLQSYPVKDSAARQIQPGCYTFSPLGMDTQLFNQPSPGWDVTEAAQEIHVPLALSRQQLRRELEELRRALVDGGTPRLEHFKQPPVIEVTINQTPASLASIDISDLSQWQRPAGSKTYQRARDGSLVDMPIHVAIDPELGRLAFPEGVQPDEVQVSYSYGFSADLGGGPYERRATPVVVEASAWQGFVGRSVSDEVSANAELNWYNSLQQAVQAWERSGQDGIIQITDNSAYEIAGADAPLEIPLRDRRRLLIKAAGGKCPCLVGDINIISNGSGAGLTLDGLLIDGLLGLTGSLDLNIAHCALKPLLSMDGLTSEAARPSVQVREGAHPGLRVSITHSITGPLRLPADISGLTVSDSIIDAGAGYAIAAHFAAGAPVQYGPPTTVERTTVLGRVAVHVLETAQDVIFTAPVLAQRQQSGCVRYSYVPDGSITPQRYNCQPDFALQKATRPEEHPWVLLRTRPSFTSTTYGSPGYAQLGLGCPGEVKAGAEDGSEMGAFHHLRQPQRMARLHAVLDEYLRHGLEVGVFYAT